MYQVSGLLKMSNCWRMFALIGTDLSRNHARMTAMTTSGSHTRAAFWYHT